MKLRHASVDSPYRKIGESEKFIDCPCFLSVEQLSSTVPPMKNASSFGSSVSPDSMNSWDNCSTLKQLQQCFFRFSEVRLPSSDGITMATEIKTIAPFIKNTEATVLVTDNELLGRYLFKDDASAFEELVRRHSGLVMGVCRNMLFHLHDAEDAFQATFLILSRKSHSLLDHGSIAGWLYQTAMRNCLQIRRRKGRARETEMIEEPVGTNEPWQTISNAQETELIYQEIDRLPKRYRDAIVLCHLQGRSRSEAAEFLDWTEAGVKAALARGRNLLRRRLIRSGLMTSVAIGMLSSSTANAQSIISEPLITSTLQHCTGLTPTISVGNGAHLVQTISNSGVLSMQTATIIKSLSLAASVALAVCVPLVLIAQQTEVGPSTGGEIVSTLESGQQESASNPVSEIEIASSFDDSPFDDSLNANPLINELNSTVDAPNIESNEPNDSNADIAQRNTKLSDDKLAGMSDSFDWSNQSNQSQIGDSGAYSIDNSKEYWELMFKSYQAQVKSLEHKTRPTRGLHEDDRFDLLSKKFEAEAKAVEARLNLQRIANDSKPKAAPQPIGYLAGDRFAINRNDDRFFPQSLENFRKHIEAKEFSKATREMQELTKIQPDSELAAYMRKILLENTDKNPAIPIMKLKQDGLVVKVNADGLYAISLGSDDGVTIGQDIIVYRNDRFIGGAKIIKIEPGLSAARMIVNRIAGAGSVEVREGDRVFVKSRVDSATIKVYLKTLRHACDAYRLHDGRYPSFLNELVEKPDGISQAQWGGPYLDKQVDRDQWGNEYWYLPNEKSANPGIFSKGPDGIALTDDDIDANGFSGTASAEQSNESTGEILILLFRRFNNLIVADKFTEAMEVKSRTTQLAPDSEITKHMQKLLRQKLNAVEQASSAESNSAVPPSAADPVRPGEVLLVESLADSTLNRRVVVRTDHTISMPLVGTVSVKGQSTQEITQTVEVKLAKFMKSPQVFVVRESASTPLKQNNR